MAGMPSSASPQPNCTRQHTRTGQHHLEPAGQRIQGVDLEGPGAQRQANPGQDTQSAVSLIALLLRAFTGSGEEEAAQ